MVVDTIIREKEKNRRVEIYRERERERERREMDLDGWTDRQVYKYLYRSRYIDVVVLRNPVSRSTN